jgi:hypothetical protein
MDDDPSESLAVRAPGWRPIAASLLDALAAVPSCRVQELVVVGGRLEVVHSCSDADRNLIREAVCHAQALAQRTCEECSRTGWLSDSGGVLRTLCDVCDDCRVR